MWNRNKQEVSSWITEHTIVLLVTEYASCCVWQYSSHLYAQQSAKNVRLFLSTSIPSNQCMGTIILYP